jgi:hypothetical protein
MRTGQGGRRGTQAPSITATARDIASQAQLAALESHVPQLDGGWRQAPSRTSSAARPPARRWHWLADGDSCSRRGGPWERPRQGWRTLGLSARRRCERAGSKPNCVHSTWARELSRNLRAIFSSRTPWDGALRGFHTRRSPHLLAPSSPALSRRFHCG